MTREDKEQHKDPQQVSAAAATDNTTGAEPSLGLKDWTLPAGVARPAAPSPSPANIPPDLVSHSRYEIQELLGTGGMGAVFKAQHRVMRRRVALKTISPSLIDQPGAVERFTREIHAA